MNKEIKKWKISQLEDQFYHINFPEYQREPNIWNKVAKQRLIDSIMRRFDIAPIYFYRQDDFILNCVDGRQRIGAIMSFLGKNENDIDNNFPYVALNELYDDRPLEYQELQSKSYGDIKLISAEKDSSSAPSFLNEFMDYSFTVVVLSDAKKFNEFNLQFARLNLGSTINSGEKLNAMVGELRDLCFNDLGRHKFFQLINIPERRYSREQTAAQILAQVFSIEESKLVNGGDEYTKTRYYDLQALFKRYAVLSQREQDIVAKLKSVLDYLVSAIAKLSDIKSRALIVSFVLFAYKEGVDSIGLAETFGEFMRVLGIRLRWQVGKGLQVDPEYYYLIEFQKHVTQASVERPAVAARAKLLEEAYRIWCDRQMLKGDEEYFDRTGNRPGQE